MKAKLFVNGVSVEINGSPDEVSEAVEKMTAPRYYPPITIITHPYITWSTQPTDTTPIWSYSNEPPTDTTKSGKIFTH